LCAVAVEILGGWKSKIDLTEPAVANQIVRLLSSPDPEVVKKAAHLCAWHNVPGAEEGLLAAIAKTRGPLEDVANALARLVTKPEVSRPRSLIFFKERQDAYTSSISYDFQQVIDHRDPLVSRIPRGDAELSPYLHGKDRIGQHWARDLASVADHSVIPILEEIVSKATDPVSRAYAIAGLGRLQPDRAVDRVLEELGRNVRSTCYSGCYKSTLSRTTSIEYARCFTV